MHSSSTETGKLFQNSTSPTNFPAFGLIKLAHSSSLIIELTLRSLLENYGSFFEFHYLHLLWYFLPFFCFWFGYLDQFQSLGDDWQGWQVETFVGIFVLESGHIKISNNFHVCREILVCCGSLQDKLSISALHTRNVEFRRGLVWLICHLLRSETYSGLSSCLYPWYFSLGLFPSNYVMFFLLFLPKFVQGLIQTGNLVVPSSHWRSILLTDENWKRDCLKPFLKLWMAPYWHT